ncbi:MAG: single-stranded DNA-binding protein [Bacteroidetes bacterium]|nr:single-stranded DNA-binding protein [Bacteroidota bacterium]
MIGVNKVILIGNLGKDPEIRNLDNGKSRVTVSIATSETYKNKAGERISNTEWHNVVFWTPLAEIVDSYLRKGSKIYVEGKISSRSYEDKEGKMRYVTEVIAREMIMLDSKNTSQNNEKSYDEGSSFSKSENKTSEFQHSVSSNESEGADELPF